MKRMILALLGCLLLALTAQAETPAETDSLQVTIGELTVSHTVNHPADQPFTDAELLMQHFCAGGDDARAFAVNQQLSQLGDTAALYRLGCHYLGGFGVEQDFGAALECFTRASDAGSDDARLALALARLNGWGMEQDVIGASMELTALAQQGKFRYELALLYLHGAYDLPAHEATALHWFNACYGDMLTSRSESIRSRYEALLAAFRSSDPTALTSFPPVSLPGWSAVSVQAEVGLALGDFWAEGRGGQADSAQAAHWYAFTTALTDTPQSSLAHTRLGEMYLTGQLGQIDPEKAIAHFLQDTTEAGRSAYRVAMVYWEGVKDADGAVLLTPDTATALSWLEQATACSDACAFLGRIYREGDRVNADPVRAARCFTLGLQNTDVPDCYEPLLAMFTEGLLNDRAIIDEIGQGLLAWRGNDHQLMHRLTDALLNGVTAADGAAVVAQDQKAAFLLMEQYHESREAQRLSQDPYFLNWLGWFYSGNAPETVARNYPQALAYYTEAAQQGNSYAMAMVGVFYQNGRGVPVSHMKARAWYRKAIDAGYTSAQSYLDALNAAYPEYPVDQPVTLTTADGQTLNHVVNPQDSSGLSDAELLAVGYALDGQWEMALEINRQLADLGDMAAMCRLGRHYLSGAGLPEDHAAAFELFSNAASAGHDGAVFSLALMYLNGWAVPQDVSRAAEMIESLGGDGQIDPELQRMLATLWRCGYGQLAPDAEKAEALFASATAGLTSYLRYYSSSAGPQRDLRQRTYDAQRAAFEAAETPDSRLTTKPLPVSSNWRTPDQNVTVGLARFHAEGRGGLTNDAEARRWYEYTLQAFPDSGTADYPLAALLRDGRGGDSDPQRAIALFCGVGAFAEVGSMFDAGVTSADGQVRLAPNAIVASAFHTWAATPGSPEAGKLLGDLFRDGSIVSANPALAALFYWGAGTQYGVDQVTALITSGQLTNGPTLYSIAANAAAAEADVSALIPALAEGVIAGRIAPEGVLHQANAIPLTIRMLESAAAAGKVDSLTAETLLAQLRAMAE